MYIANFPNSGYIGHEFTKKELEPITNEVNDILKNFNSSDRVDHSFTSTVKKEYSIVRSLKYLENLTLPLADAYYDYFSLSNDNSKKLFLNSAWVNFQEKFEFFAPHTHKGEFSFALYLKVPFDIEDELKYLSSEKKPANTATGFTFFYTDIFGEIHPSYLPVDRSWENKIIFFPGKMLHSVQPFFTSDEYRITVSGNMRFKND